MFFNLRSSLENPCVIVFLQDPVEFKWLEGGIGTTDGMVNAGTRARVQGDMQKFLIELAGEVVGYEIEEDHYGIEQHASSVHSHVNDSQHRKLLVGCRNGAGTSSQPKRAVNLPPMRRSTRVEAKLQPLKI
jgi:hypothetical protein